MGKKAKASRNNTPGEEHLILPARTTPLAFESNDSASTPASESLAPIVDTHTHVASTFSLYQHKYKDGARYKTVFDFVQAMCEGRNVQAIVDVWCEAPVQSIWRELADSAKDEEGRRVNWGGIEYWFVMGVHPHEARHYNDQVENAILEAMTHPRCVGWGEIGLDYHYDNSPRDIQQAVFERQLRQAVRLGKPLTIHTREAEEDTERIMKNVVPKDHKIHIHCFTDTPEFAARLLEHFPNLCIGVTGVITYSTNLNTSQTLRQMITSSSSAPQDSSALRILLETDAPYMVPANLYTSLTDKKINRLPLCHTGMIPWTADFVAGVLNGENPAEGAEDKDGEKKWDGEKVMSIARENARMVYGI